MLCADWPKRRVALEARLDEKERAAGGGAKHARGGTAGHVDGKVLGVFVLEEQLAHALAHGVVEAQSAPVEQDLVDVGATQAAIYSSNALVSHDDTDAMDRPFVVVRLSALLL